MDGEPPRRPGRLERVACLYRDGVHPDWRQVLDAGPPGSLPQWPYPFDVLDELAVASTLSPSAGRDPEKASPIRWHDLRHTCASFSVAREPNLFKVMKLLGHKDIQTTINRYSHLLPEEAASVAEGLDATWRDAEVAPPT